MVITDRQLLKACCTALYLWEFGDDSVKEEKRLSDKDLMKYFAGEWNELLQVNKQIDYSNEMYDKLMDSCGMRGHNKSNRKLPNINIFFNNPTTLSKYQNSLQSKKNNSYLTARGLVNALGDLLDARKGSRGGHKGSGKQCAFASRILFFAITDMNVFNYSPALEKKLKNKWGVKGVDVQKSYKHMNVLLKEYEDKLKKLPRPYLEDDIKLKELFENSNWWERRVLDLAVLQS
jgi:hypothetical protein